MKNPITNLEELRAEKEKIRLTMEMTRHEFAQSIGTNKTQLKSFVLKNVALPLGVVGAATAGYKMMSSSPEKRSLNSSNTSNGNLLFNKLFPLAINLFSAYFLKQKAEQTVTQPTTVKVASDEKIRTTAAVRELENIEA